MRANHAPPRGPDARMASWCTLIQLAPASTKAGMYCVRILDHQVNIQRRRDVLAQRGHHRRTDRDVGHEMAVHHVHVQHGCASLQRGSNLLGQAGEISRQNRWRQLDQALLAKGDVAVEILARAAALAPPCPPLRVIRSWAWHWSKPPISSSSSSPPPGRRPSAPWTTSASPSSPVRPSAWSARAAAAKDPRTPPSAPHRTHQRQEAPQRRNPVRARQVLSDSTGCFARVKSSTAGSVSLSDWLARSSTFFRDCELLVNLFCQQNLKHGLVGNIFLIC